MMNAIICGNSAKVLACFPSNYIDLTVTSPPYDDLREYDGYEFPFEEIAAQLYRVTKPGGVVVWVVGDMVKDGSETGTSFRQALYFMQLGFRLYDTMIYEKNGASHPEQKRYFQVFEYMFVFSKGAPKSVNLIRDRKNKWPGSWGNTTARSRSGELVSKGRVVAKQEYGVRFNIWRYDTGKGFTTRDDFAYEHPAMFPEKLARDHIISWSSPGDLVLDPMCGAGTTLKMAKQTDRQFIGIDMSERYCRIAKRRVDSAKVSLLPP